MSKPKPKLAPLILISDKKESVEVHEIAKDPTDSPTQTQCAHSSTVHHLTTQHFNFAHQRAVVRHKSLYDACLDQRPFEYPRWGSSSGLLRLAPLPGSTRDESLPPLAIEFELAWLTDNLVRMRRCVLRSGVVSTPSRGLRAVSECPESERSRVYLCASERRKGKTW